MTKRTPTQIETLSPPIVEVVISDRLPSPEGADGEQRTYHQSELSLRATGTLIEFLASLVADPSSGLDLDELLASDLSTSPGIATLLERLLGLGPTVLASVIAIVLGAPQDAEWIADNLSPSRALRIIQTFVQQNDVPGLVRDFTSLQGELRSVMSQFAPEPETK